MNRMRLGLDPDSWRARFISQGAVWRHGGDPAAPHALLTSGMHSDGFLNGDMIREDPGL